MNEYIIHDGILAQCSLNIGVSFSQHSKKFHDETLSLNIIKDGGVIILIENEVELRVNDLFNFADVKIVVNIFQLKA